MRVTLTVVKGLHAGRAFSFDQHDTFFVGRSVKAHFSLPRHDRYFSRMYFLVEVNPPLVRVADLGSRNRTMVNDLRVEGRPATWRPDPAAEGLRVPTLRLLQPTAVNELPDEIEAHSSQAAAVVSRASSNSAVSVSSLARAPSWTRPATLRYTSFGQRRGIPKADRLVD
jgi:serine/threonine-protein kinase